MGALVWVLLVVVVGFPSWMIFGDRASRHLREWRCRRRRRSRHLDAVLGAPRERPRSRRSGPEELPEYFRPILDQLLERAVHSPDRLEAAALALLLSENRFELDGHRPEVAGATPRPDFGPLALDDAIQFVSDLYRLDEDGLVTDLGDALKRGSHAAAWPVAARFAGLRSRLVAHPWVREVVRCR